MCQAPGPQARFPPRELVRREVADGAMRPVGVVVVDPAGEHDPGLGERVELLAVKELLTEGGVERFDEAVLPGRAGVDVQGLDAAQGEAVADGPGDELRTVVRPDVLGGAVLADGLRQRAHHVLGVDAAGHVVAHALLRELVDERQDTEGPAHGRDVRQEVPRPHAARLGGLGRHPARGEALADPLALGRGHAQAQAAAQPPHQPQAHQRPAFLPEPAVQDGLHLAVPQLGMVGVDFPQGGLQRCVPRQPERAVTCRVPSQPEDLAGEPLRAWRTRHDRRQQFPQDPRAQSFFSTTILRIRSRSSPSASICLSSLFSFSSSFSRRTSGFVIIPSCFFQR